MGKVTRKRHSAEFKAGVRRGFRYLVAVMDWASRKELSWRVSNTMEADFCPAAVAEAIERFGVAETFNTDQGSQFTSPRFVSVLQEASMRVSMDGRGRWMDNVFIERLWRSLKYECVYLHAFETTSELRAGLQVWVGLYNDADRIQRLAGGRPMSFMNESEAGGVRGIGVSLIEPPTCPKRWLKGPAKAAGAGVILPERRVASFHQGSAGG